jgi:N-acetylmuramate 1-kinase
MIAERSRPMQTNPSSIHSAAGRGQTLPPPVHDLDLAPLYALAAAAFPGRAVTDCRTLAGGGSSRQYFRVRFATATPEATAALPPDTAVAMFVPHGGKAEEIDRTSLEGRRWPFLEVRDLLEQRGVDVPRLYAEDPARGWVLLEDIGDDTLDELLRHQPAQRERHYRKAVEDLARAQVRLADLPVGSIVGARRFDRDLLLWELHHFREYGLEARGFRLSASDEREFARVAERIAARIADLPLAFVHRDYQSRNLMVRTGGELCWIDFQDALLGPRVYDLVALLNDSYQDLRRDFIDARLDDYARARGLDDAGRLLLGREFDLVTVQRKLKDAGRFVFADRVRGDAGYLQYVDSTVAKVRASLVRLAPADPDAHAMAALLARALPA